MPRKAYSNYSTRKARKIFAFASLLILFIFLLVSSSKAELLPVKTYTVADGLLRDNIYKIRQDLHEYLWFCTAEGISRFDSNGLANMRARTHLNGGKFELEYGVGSETIIKIFFPQK